MTDELEAFTKECSEFHKRLSLFIRKENPKVKVLSCILHALSCSIHFESKGDLDSYLKLCKNCYVSATE